MGEKELVMLLVDGTIKSAVLLAAVWVVAVTMRRSSAARRHLLWTVALGLSVLMPVLSGALPGWRILPSWKVSATRLQPVAPDAGLAAVDVVPEVAGGETLPTAATPADPAPSASGLAAAPAPQPTPWQRYVLIGWGAGAVLFALPILVGQLLVGRIRRQAQASSRLGSTNFRLLTSSRCRMPMAAGILHPAIILPQDAEHWDAARLESVVDHEAAHLRRHDCLWQALGQLARALYWPNPLVWMAHRQLLCEAEKACDDAVITHGPKASAYAEHLLAIATSGRSDAMLAAAAIAMARPTTLEGRLMAILDGARGRKPVTFSMGVVVLLVLAGLAVPLAMLRAQEPPAPATAARQSATAPSTAAAMNEALQISMAAELEADAPLDATPRRNATKMQGMLDSLEPQVQRLAELLRATSAAARLHLAVTQIQRASDYLQKGDADSAAAILGGLDPNLPNAVKAALGQEPARPDTGPSVVSINPVPLARGVDPQLKEVRVTFDRPMNQGGFAFIGDGPGFPKTIGAALWVDDKTCVLPVKLESGHDYWLGLNNSKFTAFRSREGAPLRPYPIWFQTAGVNAQGQKPAGPPKVLKTEPTAGANDVDPALTELRVTFDQPMTQGGFSWVGGGETFPPVTGKPHWINARTCVLPVKLQPDHHYWFSANSTTYIGFRGKNGVPSLPHPVEFTTGGGK